MSNNIFKDILEVMSWEYRDYTRFQNRSIYGDPEEVFEHEVEDTDILADEIASITGYHPQLIGVTLRDGSIDVTLDKVEFNDAYERVANLIREKYGDEDTSVHLREDHTSRGLKYMHVDGDYVSTTEAKFKH